MSVKLKIQEIINKEENIKPQRTERFLCASERNEELIKKGMTTRRGNRLMPVDKAHLNKPPV